MSLSGKLLLVGLESRKFKLKDSGIPLMNEISDPSSTNKESGMHRVECSIQDYLGLL